MSVQFHPAALREVEEIGAYYEERRSGLGNDFLDDLRALLLTLEENPLIGQVGRYKTRRMPMHRFPYMLVYRIDGPALTVVALAHYSRRPEYWRYRK